MTSETPVDYCPECGTKLSCATGIQNDTKPVVGDVTVCLNCGAIMEFTQNLRVVPLPPGTEVSQIAIDFQMQVRARGRYR